ncbi:T9SS C-terminal target domain-containing protein [candidate division KSB1 bacterium]|nr:carbohydrate binding domain-containing protein [candidate division KSB1 bacterium]RQW00043.1 MAG: T9SS C-terminal target domain-containing protein [candidate division KSB1 bacterium]
MHQVFQCCKRDVLRLIVVLIPLCNGTLSAGLSVELLSPVHSSVHPACANILLKANPATDGEEIRDILFYRNFNKAIRRVASEPWEYVWENVKPGFYPICAKVRGKDGGEAFSDTVYIVVGNAQKGDIIINGGFDCDNKIDPWTTSTHGTASYVVNVFDDYYFDDATYLAVEIDNGSDVSWHIQLLQNTGLDSGHVYQVYFYADAEEEKTIAINWQQNGDPWTVHWQYSDIVISQADYYGPYEFVCNVTDPTADFKFIIGGNDIDIFIDSVSIIDLNATTIEEKPAEALLSEFFLYPAYPNPFNAQTVIRYELPLSSDISLDVFNMQGKKVRTLETGEQSPGLHTLIWDGRDDFGADVASGVYLYRMRADLNGTVTQDSKKILLLR